MSAGARDERAADNLPVTCACTHFAQRNPPPPPQNPLGVSTGERLTSKVLFTLKNRYSLVRGNGETLVSSSQFSVCKSKMAVSRSLSNAILKMSVLHYNFNPEDNHLTEEIIALHLLISLI